MQSILCPFCWNPTKRVNRRINVELNNDKVLQQEFTKVLLFGLPNVGKSTLVKQMKVIHKQGFNETERICSIFNIRRNIIDGFQQVSLHLLEMHTELNPEERETIELFAYKSDSIESLQKSEELKYLNDVRSSECVSQFFKEHKTHEKLDDNMFYFFHQLDRILLPDYLPSDLDMLHMRDATFEVKELIIKVPNNNSIKLIDVGGQKTDRRKWIHFFEDVQTVIFVMSLSAFDQLVEVDPKLMTLENIPRIKINETGCSEPEDDENKKQTINQLDKSVELFNWHRGNVFLRNSTPIIFLNKFDVLKNKLKTVNFVDYHPKYKEWTENDNSPISVAAYMESLFRVDPPKTEHRKIYSHFTEAVSRSNIDEVFTSVCDTILNNAVKTIQPE